MSLTPIVITFGIIALVFIGVAAALLRWAGGVWGAGGGVSATPPSPSGWRAAFGAVWAPAAAEAGVLTLVAALWFASLGHGGWPTLFLLLGLLAAGGDGWWRTRLLGVSRRHNLALLAVTVAKYLVAGGVCAWRLT